MKRSSQKLLLKLRVIGTRMSKSPAEHSWLTPICETKWMLRAFTSLYGLGQVIFLERIIHAPIDSVAKTSLQHTPRSRNWLRYSATRTRFKASYWIAHFSLSRRGSRINGTSASISAVVFALQTFQCVHFGPRNAFNSSKSAVVQ